MPVVVAAASVVGPREGEGPLGRLFDMVYNDTLFQETSWEKAETRMLRQALDLALAKAGIDQTQVDFLLAGDLLNQIISSSYMAREYDIPYVGLYGACATMAEGLALGSLLVGGRFARYVAVASSSHHDTAERQYRYPTEFGYQRVPTSQWTATAAGAVIIAAKGAGPRVEAVTVGRVQDYGVIDPNDMGSAMAPAFADTVWRHLQDMSRKPDDYDLILSGDLGKIGVGISHRLLLQKGIDIESRHQDSGLLLYEMKPEIGAGASGCGCIASVFTAKFWPDLMAGKIKRMLLVATGALHSPTSCQQGESIPSIAHAVALVSETA
ncbi:MAG TPA: stage V sporulation protein AD [Firmicutes bacterium]|uniref:Stage V sporulation protein AD n=1 Tax=Candidatus Fermentithermobacillus carboniphilus TaxID=3085328 RepID=A0AAT9LG39_9FIRM|nr:MAG: stage V sporulation protein AD [Candidatus Fermentithermobacillus carboniphilus]HHW17958.1 stage V sporulation protein AD [Candidatus Fermentithermobacillaceae bacterium]